MLLSLKKDLAPLKAAAIAKVNAEKRAVCAQYITLGSEQAMIYIEKERQAMEVSANPDINPNLVKLVRIDAVRYGITLFEAAVNILTMAEYWREVAPDIEDKRMIAQDAINAATTPAEIEAAANVDWEDLAGFADSALQ